MDQKTKEEICDFINKFYLKIEENTEGSTSDKIEIRIPIFYKKSKKLILSFLTFFLKKRAYNKYESHKVARIDFSKYIEPDDWKIYIEERSNIPMKAIPKYCFEYENCWEIDTVPEFCNEDLRYGFQPIKIFD